MSGAPERIIENDSGTQSHLGYSVEIYADRCETKLSIRDCHRNRNGTLHGGLFALLLDASGGYSASRALSEDASQMVVTVSLTTNYLAAAKGDFVRSVSRVTKAGRSLIYVNGEVLDREGNLLATGSGVFKAMKRHTPLPLHD